MTVDETIQEVEKKADDLGSGLTLEMWLEVCEQLTSNFDIKAEAAREEIEDDSRG